MMEMVSVQGEKALSITAMLLCGFAFLILELEPHSAQSEVHVSTCALTNRFCYREWVRKDASS